MVWKAVLSYQCLAYTCNGKLLILCYAFVPKPSTLTVEECGWSNKLELELLSLHDISSLLTVDVHSIYTS